MTDNKGGNRSQVLMLYAATLIGVVLGFAASVINTRFLPKEDYGDVRYVQNLIQLVSWVLLFGYFFSGSRLLAVTDDNYIRRKIRGTLVIILIACILTLAAATAVFGLAQFRNSVVSRLFFLSVPVSMYPLLINYINTTAQGDNHIVRLSLAKVLPPLLYIAIAWYAYDSTGATSSKMILLQWGLYSFVLTLIVISTCPAFSGLKSVFKELNRENREYGIHLYLGSLAMVATAYVGGWTIGLFGEDNVNVGFYTLALTLTTPLSYLPGIIGTAYFRAFASQNHIPRKVMVSTIVITAASCAMFVIIVGPLVKFFYPVEYAPVSKYASLLSIGFCIHGVGDMLNRYLGSHGKGIGIRNSSIACGLFKIIGFFLLVWLWDISGAIITNLLGSCIYTTSLWIYYRKTISEYSGQAS